MRADGPSASAASRTRFSTECNTRCRTFQARVVSTPTVSVQPRCWNARAVHHGFQCRKACRPIIRDMCRRFSCWLRQPAVRAPTMATPCQALRFAPPMRVPSTLNKLQFGCFSWELCCGSMVHTCSLQHCPRAVRILPLSRCSLSLRVRSLLQPMHRVAISLGAGCIAAVLQLAQQTHLCPYQLTRTLLAANSNT